MNKKYIAILALGMLVLASCSETKELTNSVTSVAESGTINEITAATSTEGPVSYTEYNGEDLSSVGEQTVLFFHQASCGTCVKTDADIMSQGELPNDLNIIKIDFDTETELNAQYGVTTKHTFVLIDENGKMLAKEIGLATTADIAEFANAANTATAPVVETEVVEVAENTATAPVVETEVVEVAENTVAAEEALVVPVIAAASAGTYKQYDGTVPGDSVLFFSAAWCPSCVAAEKNLAAEGDLAINADVIKVDFDTETELKAKYGVTTKHTFVLVDADGNLVKKMVTGQNSSDLKALFN